METASIFAIIADERRRLADLIDGLTEEQLQTPSWVPTWTVRDVAAHLVLGFEVSLPRFLFAAIVSGGFERAADKLTWQQARRPIKELTDLLRRNAEHRFTPPGGGPETPLTELLVHGLDLRRPLAIPRDLPEERTRIALRLLTQTPAHGFVKKSWRTGLRFEAADLDWSFGEGPQVRGRSDSLLLALTGRTKVLPELEGDGVAILRERYARP